MGENNLLFQIINQIKFINVAAPKGIQETNLPQRVVLLTSNFFIYDYQMAHIQGRHIHIPLIFLD